MDLNKKRRSRDGQKLGDWDGVKRCKPHGVMIDGDNICPTCDAEAEDVKVREQAKKNLSAGSGKKLTKKELIEGLAKVIDEERMAPVRKMRIAELRELAEEAGVIGAEEEEEKDPE